MKTPLRFLGNVVSKSLANFGENEVLKIIGVVQRGGIITIGRKSKGGNFIKKQILFNSAFIFDSYMISNRRYA